LCRLGTAEVDDLLGLIEQVRPSRLVLMGWSLGAGVSLAAAARVPKSITVLGVVGEAPYRFPGTPASRVLRARGLPAPILITPAFLLLRLICGGDLGAPRFDRAAKARASGARVLVIHGTCDVVCPVQDGRDVALAAGGRMIEIEGGGHNDLWTDPAFAPVCGQAVQEFVRDGVSPA
jgi:pimeloyl-ACP methyl ester carboxylesterase